MKKKQKNVRCACSYCGWKGTRVIDGMDAACPSCEQVGTIKVIIPREVKKK